MRRKSPFGLVVVVVVLSWIAGAAALAGCGPSANDLNISNVDTHAFQVSLSLDQNSAARMVRGAITAIDADRNAVKLSADEIRIFESSDRKKWHEVQFTVQRRGEALLPLSAAICMDESGSMSGQPAQDARQAVMAFFDYLQQGDRLAIVKFGQDVKVVQGFTDDRAALQDAVNTDLGWTEFLTAAWDAAYEGVKLAAPEDAPKAVLLTSDGEDDASHEITASKLIKAAVDAGVAIFTLGMSDDENSDGMKYLFKISSETGGLFYYFQDTSQMESVYDAIAQAFNQALVATWTSTYSSGAVYVKVEVQTASDKASTISAYHF